MLRLAFDFIITWKKTRTRPNAYIIKEIFALIMQIWNLPTVYLLMKGERW